MLLLHSLPRSIKPITVCASSC
uniref:Uncharacterized protein n=1 Tax=Anguilla anguilla TaxID=7936 RepID=A0A0E9PH73_ANGAN